jgi:prepilin-type N-terminal cleavage/methylation domain-containing protein
MNRVQDQGFTLLELMIVLLVISLTLAVAYPSLSRATSSIHLRSTARDILNTFRYAREKAVTEQTGMRVTVDRDKQELVLTDDLGDGSRTYLLPGDVKIQRMVFAGNEVVEGPMLVRFLPNGSSENVEVLLKAPKTGSYLRVVTDPITGGARVEQGPGENRQ